MIVVDASVAVKWFLPEDGSDKADALLRTGQKLIAPELIRIEVAAALAKQLRMKALDAAMTRTLLDDWRTNLQKETVNLEPTLHDFDRGLEISIEIGHALQDCLYVATAERLDVPLITADEKFLKKSNFIHCELQSL